MNFLLAIIVAVSWPTFEQFREADAERRAARVQQTDAAAALMRVDAEAVAAVARERASDPVAQWGAAELLTDWKRRQEFFESALAVSGTNTEIALRYACAAAVNSQPETAARWLAFCEQRDPTNAAPWIAEVWMARGNEAKLKALQLPEGMVAFQDYAAQAARARIAVLERAGCGKYAARRIGFMPAMDAVRMAQELKGSAFPVGVEQFLKRAARAMQGGTPYLVTELAGQSLETVMWGREPDSARREARLDELAQRRWMVGDLVMQMERRVSTATEQQMVDYFDDLLLRGEVSAMQRLSRELGNVR